VAPRFPLRRLRHTSLSSCVRLAIHRFRSTQRRLWNFFDYIDAPYRYVLTHAVLIMGPYTRLRKFAGTHRHHIQRRLLEPRPRPDTFVGLIFYCNYGYLIRWFGANQHRHWSAIRSVCDHPREYPTPDNCPEIDLEMTHRIFTEDVPLRKHFTCSAHNSRVRKSTTITPLSPGTWRPCVTSFAQRRPTHFM
jgi:hypothetical protein